MCCIESIENAEKYLKTKCMLPVLTDNCFFKDYVHFLFKNFFQALFRYD